MNTNRTIEELQREREQICLERDKIEAAMYKEELERNQKKDKMEIARRNIECLTKILSCDNAVNNLIKSDLKTIMAKNLAVLGRIDE